MEHCWADLISEGAPRNDYRFVATCNGTCTGFKYEQQMTSQYVVKDVKRETVHCPDCGYALNWVRVLPEATLKVAKQYRNRVNSPKH